MTILRSFKELGTKPMVHVTTANTPSKPGKSVFPFRGNPRSLRSINPQLPATFQFNGLENPLNTYSITFLVGEAVKMLPVGVKFRAGELYRALPRAAEATPANVQSALQRYIADKALRAEVGNEGERFFVIADHTKVHNNYRSRPNFTKADDPTSKGVYETARVQAALASKPANTHLNKADFTKIEAPKPISNTPAPTPTKLSDALLDIASKVAEIEQKLEVLSVLAKQARPASDTKTLADYSTDELTREMWKRV